jgi:hypothetical protein
LNQLAKQDFFQKSLEQLFAEHPFEDSSPPFSMGTRRTR